MTHSPTIEFLLKLRTIDKRELTARDVLLLYSIMGQPGMAGHDAGKSIGFPDRSSVNCNIKRLIRHGLIEDRRIEQRRTHPNILHVTPAGLAFWDTIKP